MKRIYVAKCIEHGERFVSIFKSSETNKQKLYDIGQEHASEWGAECISVSLWKPKVTKMGRLFDVMKNTTIENTKIKVDNFIKKNPQSTRYDYSKTEYFDEVEPEPTDVWDNDLTDEENLKNYEEREAKKKVS